MPKVSISAVVARRWAAWWGVAGVEWNGRSVRVTRTDGAAVAFAAAQLRDDADIAFDPISGQRLTPAVSASDCLLCEVTADPDGASLQFEDGREVKLRFATVSEPPTDDIAALQAPSPPRYAAEAYLHAEPERRRALAAVVRYGYCVLEGIGSAPGAVERVVSAFGHVRETNYGRVFDVQAEANASNLAFTDRGLAPHTDNPYRDPPPAVQVLHCLTAAGEGGETLLVDGFAVAERFRDEDRDAFEVLRRTRVRFVWSDADNKLMCEAPVIEADEAGRIVRLRFNERALAPLRLAAPEAEAWRAAYRNLSRRIEEGVLRLRLTPGDVLLLDNARMLHGRTAYEGGARRLQGCYADRDGLLSTLAVLERREALLRADQALEYLAGPGGEAAYGECVSLRDHCLQAAAIARAEGGSDAFVAAALLHDIGWVKSSDAHEAIAADLLGAWFGEAVAAPVRLHVAAKRYLVATEPEYASCLSAASLATLEMQGGPMSAEECAAFTGEGAWRDAIRLRRIDDRAKDPAFETPRLDFYRELLAAQAVQFMHVNEEERG